MKFVPGAPSVAFFLKKGTNPNRYHEPELSLLGSSTGGRDQLIYLGNDPEKPPVLERQLDFGGEDIAAVAFHFYPWSVPDYEGGNHGGFEYQVLIFYYYYYYLQQNSVWESEFHFPPLLLTYRSRQRSPSL